MDRMDSPAKFAPKTLPARYYTDAENFTREMERFFFRGWICAGRAEQAANAGDFFLRDVAGESIIVTRDASGALQCLPPSRNAYLRCSDGRFCGSHPVSVSRLDVWARRPADRCS